MWRRALGALADLVFPPSCLLCDAPAWEEPAGLLCPACALRLPAPCTRCARCGRPAPAQSLTQGCVLCVGEFAVTDGLHLRGRTGLSGRPVRPGPVTRVLAGMDYSRAARELVLALKFRGRRSAARVLAEPLIEVVLEAGTPGDLVVAVPLSARRQRERGFNQARLIAQELSRAIGLPLAPARALARFRHTRRQSALSLHARRVGPRGAFRAHGSCVAGRCVLLVDDVLTSGATVRACALALRRAGAATVSVAVACRAAYGRGARRN